MMKVQDMEQGSMSHLRKLGGLGLAAVLGVMLFGLSSAIGPTGARAESPPNPPARFAGSVLVDGQAPPAGTTIEARIGSTTCGTTSTFNQGSESRYVLDSPALDPGATPNCGTDGAVVTFYIGGRKAQETGSWRNYDLNIVNLTYVTPTPTPTSTPAPTPKPPASGSGSIDGGTDSAATWLFAALGLGALAFGVSGVAVARKSR
jgi:hypothetical protein